MRLPGNLTRDAWLLFATRFARLFAYGALSVVLVLYLTGLGLSESQTGLLFTLILAGDTVVSLVLTNVADRLGRRRVLVAGGLLMAGAGVAFALTSNFLYLLIAGTVGVVSPSGNEVGPFLSIEQAVLAHVVPARSRTAVFAWHSLIGSFATALGSLAGGFIPGIVQPGSATEAGYRAVVVLYACGGVLLALIFSSLSRASEVARDAAAPPPGSAGRGPFKSRGLQTRGADGARRVRRGLRGAKHGGLLVLSEVRRPSRHAGRNLLRRQPVRRHLRAAGLAPGRPLRPGEHHGVHPPAVQYSA